MIKSVGFRAYRSVNNRSARFSSSERGAVINFGGVHLYNSSYSGTFRYFPNIRFLALRENRRFRDEQRRRFGVYT